MRRLLPILLLAAAASSATLLAAHLQANTGYRAAGMELLDHAHAYRAAVAQRSEKALAGPELPIPVLIAALGASLETSDDPVRAATFGSALAMAAAVGLATLTAGQLAGWPAALGAAVLMLLLPGTLFHARTLGPEAAVALTYAALIWAAAQRHALVRALGGAAALLACLASSHESVLTIIPWLLAAYILAPATPEPTGGPGVLPARRVSPAAFVPLLAAPLLLFELWPHLQVDGLKRWIAVIYEPFRAHHPPFLTLGEVRDQALTRAPNAASGLLAFLLRIPVATGALAVLGGVRIVRAVGGPGPASRRGLFAVLVLAMAAAVHALNGSPYYDDADGFAAALPMLAVLAGVGAGALGRAMADVWKARNRRLSAAFAAAALTVVVGASASELVRVAPFEPAYHNALIGSAASAAERGMETRTDHLLPAAVLNWMNERLPPDAEVAFEPSNARFRGMLDSLKRHGLLREDIQSAARYHATHVVVARMPGYPLYETLHEWGSEPLLTYEAAGVRHMSLYRF